MSGGAELREDLLAAAAEEEDTEHSWQSDSSVDVASAQRLAERLRQSDTALPEESKAGGRKAKQTWTFSSSGWLFVYHFGVVRAIKELGLSRDIHVIGSSGGACAASYLFLDVDVGKTVEYICDCASYARSHWLGPLKIKQYVRGAVRNFSPPDAGVRLSGNMEVSVTTLPWLGNARITEFADNAEMENAILASSCVFPAPPVYLPKLKTWALDGGYSDFQLIKGALLGRGFFSFHKMADAISVTPFYMSRADIKPSKYIPFWWCILPPTPEQLRGLYKLGYKDAVVWLSQNSRIPYGVMPEHQEAVEEEKPLWWTILQESAVSARSCDHELGELAVSAGAVLRNVGRCALWVLIACELAVQALISALLILVSPALRNMSTKSALNRFGAVTNTAVQPWVLLKAIPGISAALPLRAAKPELRKKLTEYSLLYRLFQYVL